MNPSINYNTIVNDQINVRRYTGFPLNSTLVSSYTADTIRSIINQAASGQAYNTPVWIQVARYGIQVSAQDPQIARTRKPVFIPLNLIHDIFMQPSISNVICIVYDEIHSNMKGVLLYVVSPTDAASIREDFRLAKQGGTTVASNQTTIVLPRQNSPRRITYISDGAQSTNPVRYTPSKSSQHSSKEERSTRRRRSPRKSRLGRSPGRPISDEETKTTVKVRSHSLDKPRKSEDLKNEQILLEQQQQVALWQANQQMPLIPMGVYNRYVPKTIPLPSGETLKTTLPSDPKTGLGLAFIEPAVPEQNRETATVPVKTSRSNSKINEDSDDTKVYLKVLIEEMQSLKAEMNRLRQLSGGPSRARSDSIQVDLRQLRTEIDTIRSRIAMTPKIFEYN